MPYSVLWVMPLTFKHHRSTVILIEIERNGGGLVEQITAYLRTIVQIMIQASDLAQILYRGHLSGKKRGPRKISIWRPFSKMAAMVYGEILLLAFKMTEDS